MLNMVAITLLLANFTGSQATTREWNAGDIYIWSIQGLTESQHTDNVQNVTEYMKIEVDSEEKHNLTAIDTVDKDYAAYITSVSSGTNFYGSIDYGADYFVEQELTVDDAFSVDFNWNYDTNETVLNSFSFDLEPYELIDPDWAVINTGFSELFNLSEIVDDVLNPYEPIIYNYTLADAFGNASRITIQGVKDNLNKSIDKFTDTTTKFSFAFDFTGKMNFPIWNGTAGYNNYYLYDIYTLSGEFSYSEGGILQKAEYRFETQTTHEDFVSHTITTATMVLGNLQSLTGNFAFLAILPAIGLIAVITRVKRNK